MNRIFNAFVYSKNSVTGFGELIELSLRLIQQAKTSVFRKSGDIVRMLQRGGGREGGIKDSPMNRPICVTPTSSESQIVAIHSATIIYSVKTL